jgi:hypothetical protein
MVIIPGSAWSKSLENNSPRTAAEVGFGMFDVNESFFYLDRELVLDMKGISPGVDHPAGSRSST